MTHRRWKLVVTGLDSTSSLHELNVEAGDWVTALTKGRSELGEAAVIPVGASCAISPTGTVTILDGQSRRQYQLRPLADGEEEAKNDGDSPSAAGAGAQRAPTPMHRSGGPSVAEPIPAEPITASAPMSSVAAGSPAATAGGAAAAGAAAGATAVGAPTSGAAVTSSTPARVEVGRRAAASGMGVSGAAQRSSSPAPLRSAPLAGAAPVPQAATAGPKGTHPSPTASAEPLGPVAARPAGSPGRRVQTVAYLPSLSEEERSAFVASVAKDISEPAPAEEHVSNRPPPAARISVPPPAQVVSPAIKRPTVAPEPARVERSGSVPPPSSADVSQPLAKRNRNLLRTAGYLPAVTLPTATGTGPTPARAAVEPPPAEGHQSVATSALAPSEAGVPGETSATRSSAPPAAPVAIPTAPPPASSRASELALAEQPPAGSSEPVIERNTSSESVLLPAAALAQPDMIERTTPPNEEKESPEPETGITASAPSPSSPSPVSPRGVPPEAESPARAEDSPSNPPFDGAEILYERDAEPSKESPLTYRERGYVVPEGTSTEDAELVLRRRFAHLRDELESRPKGKFVNLAIFDHLWRDQPKRPPLVSLQWKDWKGEAQVRVHAAPVASTPPPPTPPITPSNPASAPGEDLLTKAFEGLQDLFFLETPLEGSEYVLSLMSELIPTEASSVCIYDINTDELRFVAALGPGAEGRRGAAVGAGTGLTGAAIANAGTPLVVNDVKADRRFDTAVDGRARLEVSSMMTAAAVHQGRLQAVIQLINRRDRTAFTHVDRNVLSYLTQKLGEFLHQAGLRGVNKQAAQR